MDIDIESYYRENIIKKNYFYKILHKPIIRDSKSGKKADRKPKKLEDRAEILAPLNEVFFDTELMNDLIVRTSIPQLLEGEKPIYPGVILYGPPGTGKSEFQRAACQVYENAGAYAKQVSTSTVNSCFVGQFAKNLGEELELAQQQGLERGLPSLLCFDEGSILAEEAQLGANSVGKHYQEAIDTMKRYLGNESGSHLVLAISTNLLPEDFEKAMTREGRLTTFLIGYPSKEQIARMWQHFLGKYDVIKLTEEQSEELASITPNKMGAFIEEFSRGYLAQRRHALLLEKGYNSLLDALRKGDSLSEKDVKGSVNYDVLRESLKDYLERLKLRNGKPKDEKTEIGFHAIFQEKTSS